MKGMLVGHFFMFAFYFSETSTGATGAPASHPRSTILISILWSGGGLHYRDHDRGSGMTVIDW